MASAKMAKRIAKAGEYIQFKESYDIERLTDFLGRAKAAGHDTTWLESSVDDYNRLQRAHIETIHELFGIETTDLRDTDSATVFCVFFCDH